MRENKSNNKCQIEEENESVKSLPNNEDQKLQGSGTCSSLSHSSSSYNFYFLTSMLLLFLLLIQKNCMRWVKDGGLKLIYPRASIWSSKEAWKWELFLKSFGESLGCLLISDFFGFFLCTWVNGYKGLYRDCECVRFVVIRVRWLWELSEEIVICK